MACIKLKFCFLSLLRLDPQNNQITPEDKLTVLCEITIDGKDVQQSGQAATGVSRAAAGKPRTGDFILCV